MKFPPTDLYFLPQSQGFFKDCLMERKWCMVGKGVTVSYHHSTELNTSRFLFSALFSPSLANLLLSAYFFHLAPGAMNVTSLHQATNRQQKVGSKKMVQKKSVSRECLQNHRLPTTSRGIRAIWIRAFVSPNPGPPLYHPSSSVHPRPSVSTLELRLVFPSFGGCWL